MKLVNTGRLGLLATSAILAVAACSGANHPWWFTSGASNCATPILVRVDGGSVQAVGGCAGGFAGPPETVRLRAGDLLDLHVTQTASGALVVPIPTANQPGLLRVVGRYDNGSTVTYQADGVGATNLTAGGDCPGPLIDGDEQQLACPVLRVIVTNPGKPASDGVG